MSDAVRFVMLTGHTPVAYLTWWRLVMAAQLLRKGDARSRRLHVRLDTRRNSPSPTRSNGTIGWRQARRSCCIATPRLLTEQARDTPTTRAPLSPGWASLMKVMTGRICQISSPMHSAGDSEVLQVALAVITLSHCRHARQDRRPNAAGRRCPRTRWWRPSQRDCDVCGAHWVSAAGSRWESLSGLVTA